MADSSITIQSVPKILLLAGLVLLATGCQQDPVAKAKNSAAKNLNPTTNSNGQGDSDVQQPEPIQLFDGKSLAGWEKIQFGGEGDIEVVDGEIRMESGDPLTGIALNDEVEIPRTSYEISLQAKKRDGNDFFCALTFPVGETHCSMIVGGWAGSLVGLSNLDGRDASDNGTRVIRKFETDQWYTIRVRVTSERITCWIDDEQFVDESIVGREVSIRNDVITTTPIGICTFQTSNAIREVVVRELEK